MSLPNAGITELKPGDFDDLIQIETINLRGNELTTLPEGLFRDNHELWQLQLNDNELSTLPPDIFDGLSELRHLLLDSNQLEALPNRVFAGLALTNLSIENNAFTDLPSGVFSGATIEFLDLAPGNLTNLPGSIFAPLRDSLAGLHIHTNKLSNLPEGLLEGLELSNLTLRSNPGATFDIEVGIEREGDDSFTVIIPIGAPSDFEVPVTVTNGTIGDDTTKTIEITRGKVKTDPITVKRTAGSTARSTATLGTIAWTSPADHDGYTYALATKNTVDVIPEATVPGTPTDLTARPDGPNEIELAWTAPEPDPTAPVTGYRIEVSTDTQPWTDAVTNTGSKATKYMHTGRVAGTTYHYRVRAVNVAGASDASNVASAMTTELTGVCDRTPAVVIEIERATATDCSLVSPYQLARIEEIDLTSHNPATLADGDFGGLSGLKTLDLGSGLSALPPSLLAGLASLEKFTATSGSITSLPPGLFSGRTRLTTIDLRDNPLSSLPDGIFAGLRKLIPPNGSLDVTPTADAVTLPLGIGLRKVGEGTYRVVVPTGAPFDLRFLVTITNGGPANRDFFVDVRAGNTESVTRRVLRDPETSDPVTVKLGVLGGIPTEHSGYALTATDPTTLEVLPGEGASVFAVRVPNNQGPVGEGAHLAVEVEFDKPVTADTSGGTPSIDIDVGGTTKQATYHQASAVHRLEFRYQVAANDSDTDGVSIPAGTLALNGGAIASGTYDADLTHEGLPTVASATIDGIAPTLIASTVDGALVTLTWDEPVQRSGTGTWPFGSNIDSGTFTNTCTAHVGERSVTLTLCAAATAGQDVGLRYQPAAPATHLEDAAGNDAPAFRTGIVLDNVTQATAATISSMTISSDPNADTLTGEDETYAIGDTVEVTVTFDATVSVTTDGGTPELELDFGGEPVRARYDRAPTFLDLVFAYTVAEGDEDTDGIAIGADKLTLNGAIIASDGKNAELGHAAEPSHATHKVDGIRPTMTGAASSADGSSIVVTFSETMSSSNTAYGVRERDGDAIGVNVTAADPLGSNVTVTVVPALGHGDTLDIETIADTARDSAGNGTQSQRLAVTDGVTAPAAYLTGVDVTSTPGDDGMYVTNDTIELTATFNNAVTLNTSSGTPKLKFRLETNENRTAGYVSGSPGTALVFEYTVLSTDESSIAGVAIRANPIDLDGATLTRNGAAVQTIRRLETGDGSHLVNYDPPTLASAATASDGMSIVLTFDQTLRASGLSRTSFTVTADGEPVDLGTTSPTISGTTVTLSLTDTLIAANKVTVTYTDPSEADDFSAIQDTVGNDAASFTTTMVSNTVAPDPPDAPTGLTATTTTGRNVTLDWTAPTDTGVGDITGYRIEVSTDSAVSWEDAQTDTGSTSTTYKHEGLTPGTRYDYRVSAINADGVGTASSSINTTTVAVPTISSITITSDPDASSGAADDDYYQETARPGSGNGDLEVTVTFSAAVDVQTPTATKAIAVEIAGQTKLAAYSSGTGTTALVYTYTFEVGLEDRDGVSFPENPLRGGGIVTKDKGAGFDANLTHAAIADDAGHKVDTEPPTVIRAEAAADRQSFTVIFNETVMNVDASLAITAPGQPTQRTIPSTVELTGTIATLDNPYPFVTAGSTYALDVDFFDAGNNRVTISDHPFTTVATVPSAPQNFAALPGDGRVTLTWDAPESDGGRTIDSYDYRYRKDSETTWTAWTEVPDSGPGEMNRSRYRVMGLTNGTGYTFEVRAVNSIRHGPVAGASGMPREPGAIRASLAIDPASPVAENVGTVTVTVNAANNAPTPPEAAIELAVATADGTATAGEDYVALSQTVTFPVADFALSSDASHYEASTDLTLTLSDDIVDEGDDETFTIGLEATGDSAASVTRPPDLVVTITEDDEAPGAPTLTAEPGDAEVTLKWTAPANAGTATIDGYDYRVSEQTAAPFTWNPDWTAIAGGAGATSVTVTMHGGATLANGTAYTFEVRARSAAGDGEAAQDATKPGEVCARTKQIADAIVAAAAQSGCGDVTTTHLAGITELVKTEGNIPTLKSGDFSGLTAMTKLDLTYNEIATLPTGIFTALTQLETLILDENVFAGGTLPDGVFAGLTGLRELHLFDAGLQTLPANIFAGLSALEVLFLSNNDFQTLPTGLFTDLSALENLVISNNQLRELPAGFLTGLTDIMSLRMQDNTVDPIPLTVTLEKDGDDGFRARVREGAPFDVEVMLTINGGTIDGGATTLTVAKGSTTSGTLEVTRTAGSTDAVSVDIGTVPGLPTDTDSNGNLHLGYTLVKSDALPLTVIRADLTTTVSLGIDPASPVAEDVGTVTVTVTAATNRALAPEADVEVTVATADGTAMAGEDFESLSETVTFAIADFALVTGGTHYEAAEDVTLTVTDDALDDDDETFSIELSTSEEAADPPTLGAALTVTITDDDDAPGAPATLSAEGGFNEATLTWTAPAEAGTSTIDGYDYRVSTDTSAPYTWDPDWTAIPDSGAGGANATSYTVAMHAGAALVNGTTYTFEVRARSAAGGGEGAQATATPSEVCGRSQQVREAIIAATPVSACADVTAAHLAAITELDLRGRTIRELTSGDFAGLSGLLNLKLSRVRITTLPDGIFTGLTALTGLSIGDGDITTLRVNVFDDLTAVRTLEFFLNKFTELPAGIFDNLTALRVLNLGDNALTTLRADVFANNAALEELEIHGNRVTSLPGSIFSTTPRLRRLTADANQLNALPDGLFAGLADLTHVWLHDNPGTPFALTVSLVKVGSNGVKATIAEGAPFEIEVPVTPLGGTIQGDATTITIPTGAVESAALAVTRGADPYVAVTVDIGSPLPVPPNSQNSNPIDNDHGGYSLAKAADLPLEIFAETPSTAIDLTVEPDEVAEDAGETTLTVTATLDANSRTEDTTVTLTFGGSDDTATLTDDYTAGTVPALTISGGERTATATITFTPEDDSAQEGSETIAITGTVEVEGLTVNATTLTITDNDEPPEAPGLSAEPGDAQVTLKWTAPANTGTSSITGYDYRVSDDTAAPFTWTPDWTAIANSGPGEANAASYTVTMHGGAALANGTQYTFEVRARNAAGKGAEAQVMAKPGEVCGRTKPIADAIVAASPASECGDVTTAHLAGITELVKTEGDIPALKSGDFAGLTAMTKLDLNDNAMRTLPVDIFMGLSQLEVLILDESEFAGGTLPEGVFAGLSGLRELHLYDCGLQTLPRNIFSGLSSLEVLFLSANNFQAISGGLFTDLSTLNRLVISANELRELPEGFLTGLTNIDIVRMQHNDVDPLAITATLEKDGAVGFRARVHEGAPFDIVLPITISGGTIDGGATALTVAKGTTASTTVEVTRTPSSTDPVTVDIGTLPDVPTAVDQWSILKHRGYELVKSADLPLEVIEQAESTIIELTVDPATVDEEHGSAVTLTVTATLNAAVRTQATEVTLAVGGDDDTATATMDYTTGSVPTLTIDANAESGTATLTLTPVSDTDGEGDETVTIAGSVDVETITVNAAELAIIDNDATPVPVTLAFTSNPDTAGADDDTYAIGDVVEVTATFSAAITVTGTPRLELDIGGEPRLAECALATDTTKLACAYTVAEGDVDADGIAIGANSITLNGGTITLGSDAVTPTHGAQAADSAHKVEAVRPTLTAAATAADGTKVVLTYDETLSSTTAATSAFTVHVSTANATSTPSVSAAAASGTELSLTLGSAVKAGQVVTVDYADPTTANDANAVQDAAGNDAASLSARAVTNTVAEDATVAGLSMSLSSATLTEGGDPVTVTIETASGATFATDRAVALAWDGEALASNAGLVREPSGRSQVLIAAGESSGTATLIGVERAAYTASKTAALTATVGATQVGSENLTYADSGAAPEATIAATPAMPAEGEDITVTVTLSRAVDTDVSVPLTMTDTESVVSGTLPSGGIAIAANETTGSVTLSTAADMMTGADADVVFTLTAAEANAPYTLGTPSTITVTVLDDTSASDEITLSVSPATVDEDAGATTLTVTATMNRAAATTATTVALSVAAGTATETTDYTATTANLTIAANARTGTANLTLTPVDDTSAEADETVTVNGTVTGFTVSGAEVTILDDDEPEITLTFIETVGGTNDNVILVDEDVGQVTVALRATTADATAPTRDFVVRLQQRESARTASIEAGDYKAFERSYTFAAADFSLASGRYVRTVSKDVEIVDDRTVELRENLFLDVDNATIPRYVNAPLELWIQLNDNDTASVGFITNLHEVEEGETVRITIAISAPVAFPFDVVFATDPLTVGPHDHFSADQVQAFNAQAAEFTHRADADDYQSQRQVIEIAEYTREVSAPVQSADFLTSARIR